MLNTLGFSTYDIVKYRYLQDAFTYQEMINDQCLRNAEINDQNIPI
jgi:hypothetical protein